MTPWLRAVINNVPDTKVSFNDMVIKACAMALKNIKINSQWKEDAITINHHVNIGVAVAVEDGLVSSIKIHDAMSLSQIGGSVRDLAEEQKQKLLPTEMEGSFTVSNLGMFGIVEFNSIINQPNSAILSVGAMSRNQSLKWPNRSRKYHDVISCLRPPYYRWSNWSSIFTNIETIYNPVTMLA
jgi:pyruvate dehydrogenase E2 component (dihydrolipoamide acetyltransferase)